MKIKYNEFIVKDSFEISVDPKGLMDGPVILQRYTMGTVNTFVAWLEEIK